MKKKKESRIGAKDLCRTETLCKMEVVCNCCVYQSERDPAACRSCRVLRAIYHSDLPLSSSTTYFFAFDHHFTQE